MGDVLTFSLDVSPAGMTIDPTSGLIQWTPINAHNPVTARVTDTGSLSDTQGFTVAVANVNDAPSITSTAITTATEGELYTYDVDAIDPDVSDTLEYSLITAPDGMAINLSTGLIEWIPNDYQVNSNYVTVQVADAAGAIDTQSFTIIVANVNDPPVITSTAIIMATEDAPYTYDVDAADPDTVDTLAFSLPTSPDGMTVDSVTGLVQWTPTETQIGDNDVVVSVDDGNGGSASQAFTITVAPAVPDHIRPVVTLVFSPVPPFVNVGDTINITVDATDNVGVVSRELTINGVDTTLDASWATTYTSDAVRIFTVVGTALTRSG